MKAVVKKYKPSEHAKEMVLVHIRKYYYDRRGVVERPMKEGVTLLADNWKGLVKIMRGVVNQ